MPMGGMISGGATMLGLGIADAAGVGKNTTPVYNFGQSNQYNANAQNLGGGDPAFSAPTMATNFFGQGSVASARQAPQANYGTANVDRGLGMGALGQQLGAYQQQQGAFGQQQGAVDLARSAARGQQPSAAQLMMKQGADAAMQSQLRLAAGARGPAALASAQANAQANAANLQQQNITQMGIQRAQEMAQARGDYLAGTNSLSGAAAGLGQTAAGMRGQALAQQGQDASQAQFQAQAQLQGQAQNDAMQRYFAGLGYQTLNDEANRAMGNNALLAGSFNQQQALMQGQAAANANQDFNYLKMGLGSMQGGLGGGISGGGGGAGGLGGGGGTPGVTYG